jgi:hypothetical protein
MTPTIVFVHLNSPVPRYLKLNIAATIKKLPGARIVLIHNSEKNLQVHPALELFHYKNNQDSISIKDSLSHPRDFRHNFWFSAILRFDALRQYLTVHSGPILHLESDVIVSPDFPISKFNCGEIQIAYPVVAINRGVASTLYIRDLKVSERLVELSIQLCEKNSTTTDMEILAEFYDLYPEQTSPLAFGPIEASAFQENFNPQSTRSTYEIFQGVFDGNDMGVFLFGTDPRNSRGVSYLKRAIPGNFAKIEKWKFKYDPKRRFINLQYKNELIPVFSLHATSKQPLLFGAYSQNIMVQRYLSKLSKSRVKKWYPIISLRMGLQKTFRLIKR